MKRRTKMTFKRIYEIIIPLLALVTLVNVIIIGYVPNWTEEFFIRYWLGVVIWLVFTVDYAARLYFAQNKRSFILNNIIDLLSILPISIFMPGLRALQAIRLLYFLRVITRLRRTIRDFRIYAVKKDLHYMLLFTCMLTFIGAALISHIEKMPILDALWWAYVTITTVGYGAVSPHTSDGRLVAGALMFTGIGVISLLTANIANFVLSRNDEHSYRDEVAANALLKLKKFSKLSLDDFDSVCAVLRALKIQQIETKKLKNDRGCSDEQQR